MSGPTKRNTALARVTPLAFYVAIVAGWMAEAIRSDATNLLWLAFWTVPAAAIYLWRLRR